MIDVHFVHSPNGHKISIMLEEVGLPYRLLTYDVFEGRQLGAEFGRINPNHRLPAIVDHAPDDAGAPLAVFESGAILVYLAEKTGQLLPKEPRPRSVALQWLMWQMAGLGPMQGQAHHFLRYAPETLDYPIRRYVSESHRLLDVLNRRLSEARYVAGEEYSIADIACWPWVRAGRIIDVHIGDRAHLARWFDEVAERPAVQTGAAIPQGHMLAGPALQKVALSPQQWSNMFGERMLGAPRG